MIEADFNLDGQLGLRVVTDDVHADAFFRAEYGWAVGKPERPDGPMVSLNWRRNSLPAFDAPAGHYHQHKMLARWRYQLALTEGNVALRAAGNRLSLPMVHHMMVHPSLRWLASQSGKLLLHGSALVHKGQSVIFTGKGGTGKTTTSTVLLAAGDPQWQFHADDYTFVTESGETLAYLTRAHLYRDLLAWAPGLTDRLSARERIELEIFGRLRRWTGDRVKWPVRASLERLWPGRRPAASAGLAGVFLLERVDQAEPHASRLGDQEAVIQELLAMNFGEARHYLQLLGAALPAEELATMVEAWRERERAILQAVWPKVPFFRLALPRIGRPDPALARAIEATVLAAIEKPRGEPL